MRTVTYSLIQFLNEARRNAFTIPRFQRPFMWKDSQVKLIVDSISRNYPIGSLLLLQETDPTNPFLASRSIEASIEASITDEFDQEVTDIKQFNQNLGATVVYYVLDGQQRLTSLVRVFLQADKNHNYYFDLEQLYQLESLERNPAEWVKKRNKTTKMSTRYLRSDMITEAERCEIFVQEYFESECSQLKGDRIGQRKAAAKVNRMFETMRNYQIPLVIIDKDNSIEAICRIFETINSTGTRLTTFDLAVARFFPNPDLHKLWTESKDKYPILNKYSVDGEKVLQLIVSFVDSSKNKYTHLARSSLLKLDKQDIIKFWDAAAQALADAYQWVEDHGAIPGNIANDALLVPIAYFQSKITMEWKRSNLNYLIILEKWYFSHSLQQGARQASNYRIGLTIGVMNNWVNNGTLPDTPDVKINKNDILALHKTDSRYRTIQSILRWRNPTDILTNEVMDVSDIEDHHIFPLIIAKRMDKNDKELKKKLDSIANRLFVLKSTNRNLSDRYPSDYLGKIMDDAKKSGTLESKKAIFKKACLPVSDCDKILNEKNFDKFINERADLILNEIKTIVGDLLISTDSIDNNEEFDTDD